jgi:hypothetical protein
MRKSTLTYATVGVLGLVALAATAPAEARGSIGPAMGGYAAGAVFEGVPVPDCGWSGCAYEGYGYGYRRTFPPVYDRRREGWRQGHWRSW